MGKAKEEEKKEEKEEEKKEDEEIPLIYLCRFAALLNLNNKLRSLLPLIDLTLERKVAIDVVVKQVHTTPLPAPASPASPASPGGFKYLSGYGEQTSNLREIIFHR